MSRRSGLLWFLALAALFFLINHSAYSGFFDNDEIESGHWTRLANEPALWLKGFVTPLYMPNNFRPAGHFYFREAAIYFGTNFAAYVGLLQAIHLFNVWLVWLAARRLGAPLVAAGAASFLFCIHPALFDDVWKPMYIFDVLCGTFCLLSLLFYSQRRWVLSFIAFWLAYKSKELAIMLPPALVLYEYWFGERKFLRLIPFFAASFSFGLQGMLRNPNHDNDYTFRFTAAALATTSVFYAYQVLLTPFAGFLLPVAAWFARSRRAWFGLALMLVLFFPLLFLPGRLFAAYCYAPFVGLAIACSGFVQSFGEVPSLACFALLVPIDPQAFAPRGDALLARDAVARNWFNAIARFARATPEPGAVIYRGVPENYGPVGARSAVQYFYDDPGLPVERDDSDAAAKLQKPRTVFLDWNAEKRIMTVTWLR